LVVYKNYGPWVHGFNPISERICTIQLRTNPINICQINIYAPTEWSDKVDKNELYEELIKIYDRVSESVIKVVLANSNAKIGTEKNYISTITLKITHVESNDNF